MSRTAMKLGSLCLAALLAAALVGCSDNSGANSQPPPTDAIGNAPPPGGPPSGAEPGAPAKAPGVGAPP